MSKKNGTHPEQIVEPGHDSARHSSLSPAPAGQSSVLPLRASPQQRRPFRAADVLTGSIDKRLAPPASPARVRKQISAQLEPAQIRLLGELHARLNATATKRIEKSDLVGLGIELLVAALADDGELAPAPDRPESADEQRVGSVDEITDLETLRLYLRTHVREYERVR